MGYSQSISTWQCESYFLYISFTLLKAIDTALLGLWVDSNDDGNLQQLLESKNACKKDLCGQKLKSSKKYFAQSLWSKAHKDYSTTLAIWKRQVFYIVNAKKELKI